MLVAVVLVLLFPTTGLCWGPISHIDIATEVLNYAQLLAPQVMDLVRNFPYDYLYGNIGADIVIGKNFTEYEYHCHNWLVADQVFRSARNEHQRAFAYGYLSHLASDVIAHNYFVPRMIITMYRKRVFSHTYWEMRFDKLVNERTAAVLGKTLKLRHRDDNEILKHTLEKTLFSFSTNKNIFNGMMLMNRRRLLRNIYNGFTSERKWLLSREEFESYRSRAVDAVFDVLNEGDKSSYTRFDPTGREALRIASGVRKELNKLHARKRIAQRDISEIAQTIVPPIGAGIYTRVRGSQP